jgi:mRNA interferase HigB
VRIVSKAALIKFASKETESLEPLLRWFRIAKSARWNSLSDAKRDFPHADYVAPYTVFNIGGNKYRLVVTVSYRWQMVYVRHVLTHLAYDTGEWKKS